jgi:two-component system nitrogen regulation response regulator NtrX
MAATNPARILCVDDEPFFPTVIEGQLIPLGCEVFKASNGATALRLVKEVRPHIVLLDIMMPGMNGLETLAEIRKIDPSVGVIMVTSIRDDEVARQALDAGAYDYVTKPINFDYLETTLLIKHVKQIG